MQEDHQTHSGSSSGDHEHVYCISGQNLRVSNTSLKPKTFHIMETKGKVRKSRRSSGFILWGPWTTAQRYFSLEQTKSQPSFTNTLSIWLLMWTQWWYGSGFTRQNQSLQISPDLILGTERKPAHVWLRDVTGLRSEPSREAKPLRRNVK